MTRKRMLISTGLYVFCAVIWTVNFFLHWYQDGMIEVSTALFGVAAICFGIAAVLGGMSLHRLSKDDHSTKKEEH